MFPISVSASRDKRRAQLELDAEGFFAATREVVENVCRRPSTLKNDLNLFPGLVSRSDIEYLQELLEDFELRNTIFPGSADSLDDVQFGALPDGGTPISAIQAMASARQSICLSSTIRAELRPSDLLATRFGVPETLLPLPIGVLTADRFFTALEILARRPLPDKHQKERDRLIDAYADAQDALFEAPIAIYGDCDWVLGIASMLTELNAQPVVCASSRPSGKLEDLLSRQAGVENCIVLGEAAPSDLFQACQRARPALLIVAGERVMDSELELPADLPLLHLGFREERQLHIGYRGTRHLVERIAAEITDAVAPAPPPLLASVPGC